MFEAILSALSQFGNGDAILFLFVGIVIGFIFGAIPGLGGVIALALLLPVSWGMEPGTALIMFAGVMGAVVFGGAIPAILINTPGVSCNIATCFDGYPLAQKGKAGVALGAAATASALGAVFGLVILVGAIPAVRAIVLSFGPPEFFFLVVFGIVSIAMFTKGNPIKGLFAGGLGMIMAFFGSSPITGTLRYTMGTTYLWDGIKMIPVFVGLFAISEAINMCVKGGATVSRVQTEQKFSDVLEGIKSVFRHKAAFFRSAAIGTLIGIIPGMGGTIANTLAWIVGAQTSAKGHLYGTGEIEGIICSESSNSAKDGGALLPTIAFGVPGSAEMAILLAAFILHGIVPGPELLINQLDLVWVLIFGLLFSNIIVAILGILTAKYTAKLTAIRGDVIATVVFCISLIGAFAYRGQKFDTVLALIFGIIGYFMTKFDFSRVTLAFGLVLGSLAEVSFWQSLRMSDVGGWIFFQRPISLTLIVLTVLSVVIVQILPKLSRKKR